MRCSGLFGLRERSLLAERKAVGHAEIPQAVTAGLAPVRPFVATGDEFHFGDHGLISLATGLPGHGAGITDHAENRINGTNVSAIDRALISVLAADRVGCTPSDDPRGKAPHADEFLELVPQSRPAGPFIEPTCSIVGGHNTHNARKNQRLILWKAGKNRSACP